MLYHMPRGAPASLYCEHGFILTSLVSHPEGAFPMPGSRLYSPGFSLYCVRPLGLCNLGVLSALTRCVNKVQSSIYFQTITPGSAPLWFRTLWFCPSSGLVRLGRSFWALPAIGPSLFVPIDGERNVTHFDPYYTFRFNPLSGLHTHAVKALTLTHAYSTTCCYTCYWLLSYIYFSSSYTSLPLSR